jgi:hypothetical protein
VAVELRRGSALLDRLDRSKAPSVRLRAPRRRMRVRTRAALRVRWTSADPDSGALQADVAYSADGGRSWRSLYQGANTGRVRIPGRFLAHSRNGRVRVTVDDGFNQVRAVSARLRADGRPPSVNIARPVAREVLRSDRPNVLVGSALDDLGRPVKGRALTWYAGRKRLGRGAVLRVRKLPARARTIRLEARVAGLTGRATRRVKVATNPPRLTLLRAPRLVGARAHTVRVRVRATKAAVLAAGRSRYRVGTRARTLKLRLPARPKRGVLRVRFRLSAGGGRTSGVIELVRF